MALKKKKGGGGGGRAAAGARPQAPRALARQRSVFGSLAEPSPGLGLGYVKVARADSQPFPRYGRIGLPFVLFLGPWHTQYPFSFLNPDQNLPPFPIQDHPPFLIGTPS